MEGSNTPVVEEGTSPDTKESSPKIESVAPNVDETKLTPTSDASQPAPKVAEEESFLVENQREVMNDWGGLEVDVVMSQPALAASRADFHAVQIVSGSDTTDAGKALVAELMQYEHYRGAFKEAAIKYYADMPERFRPALDNGLAVATALVKDGENRYGATASRNETPRTSEELATLHLLYGSRVDVVEVSTVDELGQPPSVELYDQKFGSLGFFQGSLKEAFDYAVVEIDQKEKQQADELKKAVEAALQNARAVSSVRTPTATNNSIPVVSVDLTSGTENAPGKTETPLDKQEGSTAPQVGPPRPTDSNTPNAGSQVPTGDSDTDLTPNERDQLRSKGWTDEELWNISVEDARAALAGTFPLATPVPGVPDDQTVPTSAGEPVATPREGTTAEGEVPSAPQTAVDSIRVGPPRPNGEEAKPQANNIDMDALLARLEPTLQPDKSVLYTLDGEPAFIDRGTRLDMADGASQNEEKVLAALLTAAQYYRGRIELTGSDAFQRTAIGLIAKYQLNVMMKNPGQQVQLEAARKAMATAPVVKDAIAGDAPPAYGPLQQPATPAAAAANTPASTDPAFAEDPLVTTAVYTNSPKPTSEQAQPGVSLSPEESTTAVKSQAEPKIPTSIHQSTEAAKNGITGKVMDSGNAPFRFDEKNGDSVFIKLRTKTGIETFWGKELAGLLRESRVQPGAMVTLQWLGKEAVVVKVPIKDEHGVTLRHEDKNAHRNQWSLALLGGATVRTGKDEGVKLSAYEAHRFNLVQQDLMTRLRLETPLPSTPKDGLYWMTPNGQGSAKVGDELTAPRPNLDKAAGQPVMSSWSADGHLEMALVRGDGPYLQGVVRHAGQYQHVLVSLPGSQDAPPMVINAITPEGLVPIGTGNAINHSGGEPVSRENIAFKLDGDSAVRIGKLDNPAEVNPVLHARLGFDERWRDDNTLPKSAPAAAPTVQPGAHRPA